AALINIFNPELIIIGGTLARSEEYLILPLNNAINKYSLSIVNKDTKIALSTTGQKFGALGASLLLRDRLLDITEWDKPAECVEAASSQPDSIQATAISTMPDKRSH